MNPFAKLFELASKTYCAHGSKIGRDVAEGMLAARQLPIEAAPATVLPVKRHLPELLKATQSPMIDAISQAQHMIAWRTAELGPIPVDVGPKMAFCEILGPNGTVRTDAMRAGLFLQQPDLHYSWHSHQAEELYLTLSGSCLWRTPGRTYERRLPGEFIHHAPWQSHAMKTGQYPLLAMWVWTGNIDVATYRMDEDSAE